MLRSTYIRCFIMGGQSQVGEKWYIDEIKRKGRGSTAMDFCWWLGRR